MASRLKKFALLIALLFQAAQPMIAQVEEKGTEQSIRQEEAQTKKEKFIALIKNHKKKIGTAVAVALILYFFGGDPGKWPPDDWPPPPDDQDRFKDLGITVSRGHLSDDEGDRPHYGRPPAPRRENFYRFFYTYFYQIPAHRIYLSWHRIHYLIFLLLHNPRELQTVLWLWHLPERGQLMPRRMLLN